MPQTSYSSSMSPAFAGMKADLQHGYTRSYVNAEASAEIPFGVVVKRGAADGQALLTAAAGDKLLGLVLHSHAYDKRIELGTTGVKPKYMLSVMTRGTAWVQVEEAVTQGDQAFCRFASGAGGTQKGAFRKSADTATAEAINGRYLTSASASGFAQVEVDFSTDV